MSSVMARLKSMLQDIDADAASLSISASSVSDDSTVRGIGMISGRAIFSAGMLALRGIEKVNIQLSLRKASALLRGGSENIPVDLLKDLMELQR